MKPFICKKWVKLNSYYGIDITNDKIIYKDGSTFKIDSIKLSFCFPFYFFVLVT